MKSTTPRPKDPGYAQVGLEAARWLMRLQDCEFDPQDAQTGPQTRDEAFLRWLAGSAQHVRVFLETFQTSKLLEDMDPQCAIKVQELLENRNADVIPLPRTEAQTSDEVTRPSHSPDKRRVSFGYGMRIAASVAVLALLWGGTWLALHPTGPHGYSTAIGEQRMCKLEDGSFIHLNTDSVVEVRFSDLERRVRLISGEALFVIERESRRPFIVDTDDAAIRVLGTRFNVRRRAQSTDIAVVEGVIQVSAPRAGAQAVSSAGQSIHAAGGQLTRQNHPNVENVLAWRERRLVFTEAPLAEVAAEFNRYNLRQIRVKDEAAQGKRLTGIFDADRPNALILYAMKDDTLRVEPHGADWVIRAR